MQQQADLTIDSTSKTLATIRVFHCSKSSLIALSDFVGYHRKRLQPPRCIGCEELKPEAPSRIPSPKEPALSSPMHTDLTVSVYTTTFKLVAVGNIMRSLSMDLEEKKGLVTRNTEEVVTQEELQILIETNGKPRAYWGFESSGQ